MSLAKPNNEDSDKNQHCDSVASDDLKTDKDAFTVEDAVEEICNKNTPSDEVVVETFTDKTENQDDKDDKDVTIMNSEEKEFRNSIPENSIYITGLNERNSIENTDIVEDKTVKEVEFRESSGEIQENGFEKENQDGEGDKNVTIMNSKEKEFPNSISENSSHITELNERNSIENTDIGEDKTVNEVEFCESSSDIQENGIKDASVIENSEVPEKNGNLADLHTLQLQELIESVIKEADLKAQAIMEQSITAEPAIDNNVNSPKSLCDETSNNGLSESDEKSSFIKKIEENHHESCLANVDLFYNIISFISQTACKDEFALLYYLKEQLNSLNNIISATVLCEKSKELLKSNKGKANRNRKKDKKPKESLTEQSLNGDNISENNIADTNSTTTIETIINNISENGSDNQVISEYETADSVNGVSSINDNKSCDDASSIMTTLISDSSIMSGNADMKVNNVIEISENGPITDVNGDSSSGMTSDSDSKVIEASELNNSLESNVLIEEENELLTNGDATCSEDVILDVKEDENCFGTESPKNVTEIKKVQKTAKTEDLEKEHKILSNAIMLLEENEKCCLYPNPFDILSKLNEVISHVICESECHEVQTKLHSFLHTIIIDWAEKFCVGEIKYVCKICNKEN